MKLLLPRRRLLGAALGGLLLPRALTARSPAPDPTERKFLFLFVQGGWDTSYVFTPMLDNPYTTPEEGAVLSELGGIPFVDRASRPAVRSFFESYASVTALLNGVEVRSVTHERCRQIALTGSAGAGRDDWPSLLAASSKQDLLCPYLVIDGLAFTAQHSSNVVRVGDKGQLADLMDNSALDTSTDQPVLALDPALGALADGFLQSRLDQAQAAGPSGQAERFYRLYQQSLERAEGLIALEGLTLDPTKSSCSRNLLDDARTAFDCFQAGVSRCAMIRHQGWCEAGWDTHENNAMQDTHYEDLFGGINALMAELSSRPGSAGGSLLDEVCVVVFSEMGRHPRLNSQAGKDHWTFTSAMLIGAGVQGGQSLGGLDEQGKGLTIDPDSGEATDSGLSLTAAELGATLLTLGGEDPMDHGCEGTPIRALLRS